MDRGAWQIIFHGVTRVRHHLAMNTLGVEGRGSVQNSTVSSDCHLEIGHAVV